MTKYAVFIRTDFLFDMESEKKPTEDDVVDYANHNLSFSDWDELKVERTEEI